MRIRERELIGLDAPIDPRKEADLYIADMQRWWPPPRGIMKRETDEGVEVAYYYRGASCVTKFKGDLS